ncbi:hypothetical protein Taro_039271 [Colocasia esculenta]|uniref:Small ribosomal subunit protein uS15c n=1 Tax=Colocasia esculenta TaxID=4460 RepID=A0A843WPN9_COLES|nr:hypothetical protein [Colocasia esculenta]
MALRLRPKLKPRGRFHSLRLSSSSSPPPPPLSSNGARDGGDGERDDALPSSYDSLFNEVKARLKQAPPSTPRRIPLSPPEPPPVGSQSAPPSAAASLEEIRRNLADFRLDRKPPLSSGPAISFQDIYKNSVLGGADDAPAAKERPSLESIRESLRQLRAAQPPSGTQTGFGQPRGPGPGGLSHPFDLQSLKDRLNLQPGDAATGGRMGGGEPLPDSIFGRELSEKRKGEEGGKEPAARKTEFLKLYDFEELGDKLRRLRPEEAEAGKKKKGWFSLEELNERLAKLRELEEKETYSIGGVSFRDLRDSLLKLRDADNKKTLMNKFSILSNLGGQVTPIYMLKPPKEHLYFHPDHLSAAEKLKLELKNVRDDFKMSESDCGSTRVQVAQLTTRIRYLEPILYTKKKGKGLKGPDKHSIKGLVAMVKKRNKLLKYLRRTDWESYCMVLSKLELRDIDRRAVKVMKGSKGKKRGKKGKGKYSKKANYET